MDAGKLAALRRALAAVPLPDATPSRARGWLTGIAALDGLLPRGVPRGRLVEWAGARTSGKSAALAGLVRWVLEAGEGVAYVHSAGTLDPGSWAWAAGAAGAAGVQAAPFWVVRVREPGEVWPALEVVLRMGVFGLVVSEGGAAGAGAPPNAALRLSRLARASDATWVVVVRRPGSVAGAALRVGFELRGRAGEREGPSCRVEVRVVERGRSRRAEFPCEIVLPYRLCDHSGLPDRRVRTGRRG